MTAPYVTDLSPDIHDTDRFDAYVTADEAAQAWLSDFFRLTLHQQERAYRVAEPHEKDLIDAARAVETAIELAGIDALADDLRTERSVA
jgi:hypothetical protein